MFPCRNLFIILIIILYTAMAYSQTEQDIIKTANQDKNDQIEKLIEDTSCPRS